MKLLVDEYVRVRGHDGVAWVVLGPEKIWEPFQILMENEETGETWWDESEVDGVWVDDPSNNVRLCMVGDDRVYVFNEADLEPLRENEFCGTCGQIGCAHG